METKHIEKPGVRKFASMNSSTGFISYFDDYFNSLSYLYILKGGPGTGKSFLMNRLADAARQKGYSVTYFHCSSDPESLDGIIINELNIGMMDGTAPHIKDPKYPGVKEEIINLGQFWRSSKLLENKISVKKLSDEKSVYYTRAISLLSLYDKTQLECEKMISKFFNSDKAYSFFLRLFKNARSTHKPHATPFVYESPGMLGLYSVPFPKDTVIYNIPSFYSSEYLITDCAVDVLFRLGISHEYSYSPLRNGRINAIYVPSANIAICTDSESGLKEGYKNINPKRFIDLSALSPFKKELRSISKASEPFLEKSLFCFETMRSIHFGLEDIYLSAMDLSDKERFSDKLIKNIIK